MNEETTTALGRYIDFADRYAAGNAQIEELRTIFAEDATVDVIGEPIKGIDALLSFYARMFGGWQASKHFWTTTIVDDNTVETEWAAIVRLEDGSLRPVGGYERARLNADGLMVDLRNYPSKAES